MRNDRVNESSPFVSGRYRVSRRIARESASRSSQLGRVVERLRGHFCGRFGFTRLAAGRHRLGVASVEVVMPYAVHVVVAVWISEFLFALWNYRLASLAFAPVLRRFRRANGEYDSL